MRIPNLRQELYLFIHFQRSNLFCCFQKFDHVNALIKYIACLLVSIRTMQKLSHRGISFLPVAGCILDAHFSSGSAYPTIDF